MDVSPLFGRKNNKVINEWKYNSQIGLHVSPHKLQEVLLHVYFSFVLTNLNDWQPVPRKHREKWLGSPPLAGMDKKH
jgi:hypothetical protein